MAHKTPELSLTDELESFWELFSEICAGFQRFDSNGNVLRIDWQIINAWENVQQIKLDQKETKIILAIDSSYVSELQKEVELFRVRQHEKGKSR